MAVCFALSIHWVGVCQSARVRDYSENVARSDPHHEVKENPTTPSGQKTGDDVIRVDTDLVVVPVRVTRKNGRAITDIRHAEFKIFENGQEQAIEYFSSADEPFTVALVLDMSYSSVFRLSDIQSAALAFLDQLKPNDRVMVVSFDEKVRVLCKATDNRRALRYAIEGAKISSGTSLYTALDKTLNEELKSVSGRKAIVLLSDGVDTTSVTKSAADIVRDVTEADTIIYSIRYDTFDDVRTSRRKDAQILYDENDKPYVVEAPLVRGEKEGDYETAREFLREIAETTGGRVQRVTSTTNLNQAFASIADELRKTYSLGYYPQSERTPAKRYFIRVRVYRPNLDVRARESYSAARRSK